MVLYGMPVISAHSDIVCVAPLSVRWTVERRFLACAVGVRHSQFPGSYPLLLSIRSRLVPAGRFPMSEMNASEDFHLSQTVIPLPT